MKKKHLVTRRNFLQRTGVAAGGAAALSLVGSPLQAARDKELNILCWEGYNSDEVLDPFRRDTGAKVRGITLSSLTSSCLPN